MIEGSVIAARILRLRWHRGQTRTSVKNTQQVGPRIVATLDTSLRPRSHWAGRTGLGLVGARRLWLLRDGDDRRAKAGGGSEDTVIGDEWAPWPGNQTVRPPSQLR